MKSLKSVRLKISYFRLDSGTVLLLLLLTPALAWGLEDKIVFVSTRNFTPEVFLVEGLNSRPIQLTRNRSASWPSISPDGTEVVFVSSPLGEPSNILKLHIATRKTEKLMDDTEDTRYTDLDWSPDGRQILFIKAERIPDFLNREKTVLCVMDMNTRDIRHILQPNLPSAIFHPSWSPDSQHILYLHLREHREHAGLFTTTLMITDDNGNNVIEVNRDNLEILPDISALSVPTWSPSRSQIAYIGSIPASHTRQIYGMNLDEGSVTTLTSGGRAPRVPLAWRPDGQKILYLAQSHVDREIQAADICVMDPDGGNKINLTRSAKNEWSAGWSPNGRQIAFSRDVSIFVMDANGQNQQRLTFEPGIKLAVHWSPNGHKIAFLSFLDGVRQIYTVDTNGKNVQQITHRQREFYGAPTWSPEGRWLAFGAGDARSWGIYLIDPQGDSETLIIRSEVNDLTVDAFSRPTWSPDSRHLIYVDPEFFDDVDLMKVKVDGSMPTQLNTAGLSLCAHPLWSPDGNSLLFSGFKTGTPNPGLFLMNLTTSETRHFILPGIGEEFFESDWTFLRLVWAPDGSQCILSVGETRIKNQGRRRLYLIDIASETVRLWMDNAGVVDWVRPGFVYAVNPCGKRIATWAEMKEPELH